jgi:hypothetical protein
MFKDDLVTGECINHRVFKDRTSNSAASEPVSKDEIELFISVNTGKRGLETSTSKEKVTELVEPKAKRPCTE